jgi:hypothetical protein
MVRLGGLVVLLAVFALSSDLAWSQATKAKPAPKGDRLPIPDHALPMNLAAWKQVFIIQKMTYNKEDGEILFLVKAKKNFAFTDDGYDAPFEFLDEDGVNLVNEKNLRWEKEPKELRAGEVTRVYLTVPDDEILEKTKKTRAVVKGFFNK